MIVEDERLIGLATRKMLEINGYNCLLMASGEEAIEAMDDYSPDLILMDIGLSGNMDGITAARIIRKEHDRSVPIIYTTQQVDDYYYQQARETWPRDYLTKPFLEKDLLRKIELTIQEQEVLRESAQIISSTGKVLDGIFIRTGNAHRKILYKDILYLNATKSYTHIYCKENGAQKCYTVTGGAVNLIPQINYPAIVKVQKSYYVNIDNIDGVKEDEAMIAGNQVPIGREYRAEFLRRITIIKTPKK